MPGQIALARSPCLMKSAATALVRPITAAFVAPYTYRFGIPRTDPAPEAMFTIEADRPDAFARASMPGMNARIVGAST